MVAMNEVYMLMDVKASVEMYLKARVDGRGTRR